MGLISEEVEVRVSPKTYKYYESLGYIIPKKSDNKYDFNAIFIVKIKDLNPTSNLKVKVKCDNCNKEYYVSYFSYVKQNHDGKTYCKDCAMHVLLSGKNSPHYKHELTDEERNKRKYRRGDINLITWSKRILARDNYTCQKCGKKHDEQMVSHHIDSYDWCKENARI